MFIGTVFAVANAEFLIGFSKTWMVEVNDAKDNYIEDSLDSKLSQCPDRWVSSDTIVPYSVVCACLVCCFFL